MTWLCCTCPFPIRVQPTHLLRVSLSMGLPACLTPGRRYPPVARALRHRSCGGVRPTRPRPPCASTVRSCAPPSPTSARRSWPSWARSGRSSSRRCCTGRRWGGGEGNGGRLGPGMAIGLAALQDAGFLCSAPCDPTSTARVLRVVPPPSVPVRARGDNPCPWSSCHGHIRPLLLLPPPPPPCVCCVVAQLLVLDPTAGALPHPHPLPGSPARQPASFAPGRPLSAESPRASIGVPLRRQAASVATNGPAPAAGQAGPAGARHSPAVRSSMPGTPTRPQQHQQGGASPLTPQPAGAGATPADKPWKHR